MLSQGDQQSVHVLVLPGILTTFPGDLKLPLIFIFIPPSRPVSLNTLCLPGTFESLREG
jgi:hypothetical protein